MIRHERSSRNINSRKTDISALFTPVPLTFDDCRRKWRSYVEQEAAATSVGLRAYFAAERTRLLEQFPAHELPTILDKLNAPLEGVEEVAHVS